MTASLLRRLRRDRRGVAAVEFAFWSTLILGALVPCLDFPLYLLQSQRLSGAVGQASILAYNMRNAGTVDVAQLSQYVVGGSGAGSAVTAAVTCNGGQHNCTVAPANRTCACVTSGAPVTFSPTGVCGATCASGATSGFYLTVSGSSTYRAFVPNPWLNGRTMSSTTTVRLQ